MSSRIARVLGIGFVTLTASMLAMSCASSDNGTTFPGSGGSNNQDSGVDSSFGGSSGTGGGMSTGGSSFGGSSATGGSSSGGTGGAIGTGGTTSTGGASGGSCNPAFCPSSGFGTACCVTPNGPCGTDTGTGCQQGSTSNDF